MYIKKNVYGDSIKIWWTNTYLSIKLLKFFESKKKNFNF